MGTAQTIPGVSGGTIAFVTGIYNKLIYEINSINPKTPLKLLKLDFRKFYDDLMGFDYGFLLPLGFGILFSMWASATVVTFALKNYTGITFGFFTGLILGSAVKISYQVSKYNKKSVLTGFIGLLFGLWVTGLTGLSGSNGLITLFLAGFLSVCALLLPGLSGSLVLMIIGQYERVMSLVSGFQNHLFELSVFFLGGVVSLLTFVKLLSLLLKKHRNITTAFLTGLVFGSLRLPLYEVYSAVLTGSNVFYTGLSFALGLVSIHFIGVKGDN